MTKQRLFKKSYGMELMQVAFDDLDSAEALNRSDFRRYEESIAYYSQEEIDAVLKGTQKILQQLEQKMKSS